MAGQRNQIIGVQKKQFDPCYLNQVIWPFQVTEPKNNSMELNSRVLSLNGGVATIFYTLYKWKNFP